MMEPPWSNGWHTESNEHWEAEEQAHFDPYIHTSHDPRNGYFQPAPVQFHEYAPPFAYDDPNTSSYEDNLGYEMNAEWDQQEMMEMDTNNSYQDMYMYSHDTYTTPISPDVNVDQGITYSEMKDMLQQILDIQGTQFSLDACMTQKEPELNDLCEDMIHDEGNEAHDSLYTKHEKEEGSYWIIDGWMSWVAKTKEEPITIQHESAFSISKFGDTSLCPTQKHSSGQHFAPIEAEQDSCFEENEEEEEYNCAGDLMPLEDEFNDTPLESSISILNLERPPQDLPSTLPLAGKEANEHGTFSAPPSPPSQLSPKIEPKGIIEEECQADENEKAIEEICRLLYGFNDEELIVASKLKVDKSTKEEIVATKNEEKEKLEEIIHLLEVALVEEALMNYKVSMIYEEKEEEEEVVQLYELPGKLLQEDEDDKQRVPNSPTPLEKQPHDLRENLKWKIKHRWRIKTKKELKH